MFQKVDQNVLKNVSVASDSIKDFKRLLKNNNLSSSDKLLYSYLFILSLDNAGNNNNILNVSAKQAMIELNISFVQYYRSRQVLVKQGYIQCYSKALELLESPASSSRIEVCGLIIDNLIDNDDSDEENQDDEYESDDYEQDDDQDNDYSNKQPISQPNRKTKNKNKSSSTNNSKDIILSSFLYDDVDRNTGHIEKITLSEFNKLSPKKRETFLRSIMDQDLIAKLGLLDEFYAIDRSKPALVYNLINNNEQDIDSIPF